MNLGLRRREKNGAEKILEYLMAKNFTKLMKIKLRNSQAEQIKPRSSSIYSGGRMSGQGGMAGTLNSVSCPVTFTHSLVITAITTLPI